MEALSRDVTANNNANDTGFLITASEEDELSRRNDLSGKAQAFDQWGETSKSFVGVYVDNTKGDLVVDTVDAADTPMIDKVAAEAGLQPGQYRIAVVKHSLSDLAIAQDRFMSTPGVTGVAVDVESDGLDVFVVGSDVIANLPTDVGVPVRVREGTNTDDSCVSRSNCPTNLRAGLKLSRSNGSYCTSGFVADTPGGSERIITAGHCWYTNAGALLYNGGDSVAQVGTNNALYAGTRSDSRLVTSTYVGNTRPWIYLSSSNKGWHITSVRTTVHQGDTVCIRAVGTSSCGAVESANFEYNSSTCGCRVIQAVVAHYTSVAGASGGPITGCCQYHVAFGINSGTSSGLGRFTTAHWAEQYLNVTIRRAAS